MKLRNKFFIFMGLAVLLLGAKAIKDNTLTVCDGLGGNDCEIVFDAGLGANNPRFKWNDAANKLQFTNDNANVFDIGSGSGSGSGTNIVENPGAENGVLSWTNTGGGTFSATTTAADVAVGGKAFEWNASAASDTLTSDAVSVDDFKVIKDRLCIMSGWYKGGDANIKLQVWDGSAVLENGAAEITLAAATEYRAVNKTFICPDSGTLAIRVEATADAALVNFDEFFLGTRETNLELANSKWEDYTPQGSTTNIPATVIESKIKHHGKLVDIKMRLQATGPATDTVAYLLNDYLPASLSLDTSGLISRTHCGTAQADDSSAASTGDQFGAVTYISNSGVISFVTDNQDVWDITVPFTWASGDIFYFECHGIPVNESSNGINTLVQDNLSDERDYAGVWTTSGGGENLDVSVVKTTYSKMGQFLLINWSINFQAGSLNFGSGNFQFSIPSGLVPDVSLMGKIQSTPNFYNARGSGFLLDNSASNSETTRYVFQSGWDDVAKQIILYGDGFAPIGTSTLVWGAGDTISFDARIPIVGWEGTQQSLVGFTEATETNSGLVSTTEQTISGDKTILGNVIVGDAITTKNDNIATSFVTSSASDGAPFGATNGNETSYWFYKRFTGGPSTYQLFTATPDGASDGVTFHAEITGADGGVGGAHHWSCISYASDSNFSDGGCTTINSLDGGIATPTLAWVIVSGSQRRLEISFPDNSSGYTASIQIVDRNNSIDTIHLGGQ